MLEPIENVMDELKRTVEGVSFQEEEELVKAILEAKHVFVAGAGRSGMIAGCFAMRLMHAGIVTYRVGESTTPGIGKEDLLVIASGSGTTASLLSMAEKARKIGAKVALVTIYPDSAIGKLASIIIHIHAFTCKSDIDTGVHSVQPMGNLFERSLLISLDYVVEILMDKLGLTGDVMFQRHANLE